MREILERVLSHPELVARPPVLIDIGASGALHKAWRPIAEKSICVGFDADARDFSVRDAHAGGFKRLVLLNRVVAEKDAKSIEFFLTRSPHCSSSLQPDNPALAPWAFRDQFLIERRVTLPSIDLNSALESVGVSYVDWYKSDTQGTDLRIFKSLNERARSNVLVAEFEPGVIDAYVGEDKLHHVLSFMDSQPFWVSEMVIKGSQRMDEKDLSRLRRFFQRYLRWFLKRSPGWCEITYFNQFEGSSLGLREYLLGWVFATIRQEHGFAMHLANHGAEKFAEPMFAELFKSSRKAIVGNYSGFVKEVLRRIIGRNS